MGANIGTTVTAFIIGIDLGEYAMPILALGAFLNIFLNALKSITLAAYYSVSVLYSSNFNYG